VKRRGRATLHANGINPIGLNAPRAIRGYSSFVAIRQFHSQQRSRFDPPYWLLMII
jgi:hypothetical protein